jgi:dihydrofolate reductase
MRKLIFKIDMTLDGFISGPKGEMDWGTATFGAEENWKRVFDTLSTVDTVLMSRVIYQIFKEFWPGAGVSTTSSKSEKEFSNWLDNVPKIVFSKTLESVDWMNARLVKTDAGAEISRLKQQPGKNLIMWGGSIFPQALMKLGSIDEYWINVHRVILGSGKRLFTDTTSKILLSPLSAEMFETGTVGLCYSPDRARCDSR